MSNKKVLGICASGHENGNSSILLNELLRPLREKGHDIEIVNLGRLNILPCTGCFGCLSGPQAAGNCVLQDDLEFIKTKIREADAIAVSAPSYCLSAPSRLRAVMERISRWALNEMAQSEKKKYGAAVSVAGGTFSLLRTPLSLFLTLCHCEVVGQFTMGNAFNKGEVLLLPSKLKQVAKLGASLAASLEQDQCIKSAVGQCEDRLICTNCFADTFQIQKDGRLVCPVCRMELKRQDEEYHSVGFSRFTHEGARLYAGGIKSNALKGMLAGDEIGKRLENYLNHDILPDKDFVLEMESAGEAVPWNNEALEILDALAPGDVREFIKRVIEKKALQAGLHCITRDVLLTMDQGREVS
ncbi:proto-chlorophyllide reductase 57 kd subunit [Lucifera butyrica]|uniref:Proto-chlorophyllide reductase 57 kd subunit n=1 Tax=Lucifera butyrica TaxID=1351585 RepID=A0A498R4N6_9FIRM|nr:NAD(P)H-dependent oxidoreductase [Lucifera butyrica]VBB05770.1 proto-chlorophyllide reductase 57 kd subunit [Lucifera butyrica]